ncbi:hypothetical protein [Streptomyces sp. SID3343]|uniref:hypothetical protein n=1 Tax=Streptomyces sp. SID3343 TaxID=2690260 RepID=UPI00136FA745|nr:hypothetical protein [Streptomyces sp. SID3343]MYW03037.1 hypothetical protein [Streptomyces sp. SID3343]
MSSAGELSEEELQLIEERAGSATPGPWFVRDLDDRENMSLTAVSTMPGTGFDEKWPNFNSDDMVALTLVQDPEYATTRDELWDQNADFIACARQDIPRLISEVRRLRSLLK